MRCSFYLYKDHCLKQLPYLVVEATWLHLSRTCTQNLHVAPDFLHPSDCFILSRISCHSRAMLCDNILCFSSRPTRLHSAMLPDHLSFHIMGHILCLRKYWPLNHKHRGKEVTVVQGSQLFSRTRYNEMSFSGFLLVVYVSQAVPLYLHSLLGFLQALLMVLVLGWVFVPIYIKAGVSIHISTNEHSRSNIQNTFPH